MSHSIPEEPFSLHCLDFHTEDRLTPRWHVGQPCRKASWESLMVKAGGKATNPLTHAMGSVTLMLHLGKKENGHDPSGDQD